MTRISKSRKLKKVNFMVRREVFENESLVDFGRRIAAEHMDKFRKEGHWHMTDAEIRKAREYGRE